MVQSVKRNGCKTARQGQEQGELVFPPIWSKILSEVRAIQKTHDQKINRLRQSRALKLRLDTALLSPARAHQGSGFYLSPLTINDLRRTLKSQLAEVAIKRLENGYWAIIRGQNWGERIKVLPKKAHCKTPTSQEISRWVREAVEGLRQTLVQVRKTMRLLRKILAPRKSPRRRLTRRRNVVLMRSRLRQSQRRGQTQAPTDASSDRDGDSSDSSHQVTEWLQRTKSEHKKVGLDKAHLAKPDDFILGGVAYDV